MISSPVPNERCWTSKLSLVIVKVLTLEYFQKYVKMQEILAEWGLSKQFSDADELTNFMNEVNSERRISGIGQKFSVIQKSSPKASDEWWNVFVFFSDPEFVKCNQYGVYTVTTDKYFPTGSDVCKWKLFMH